MKTASNPETLRSIGNSLRFLKALGDSLVCIGDADRGGDLLDGTVAALGYAIIDKVDEIDASLVVL
jgi:hypothetical protein